MGEFEISSRLPTNLPSPARVEGKAKQEETSGAQSAGSFLESLKEALGNVNESLQKADSASQKFATGKADNLHDVMIAMEKADLSLRTLSAVRGKVVDAYHEIMRMPV